MEEKQEEKKDVVTTEVASPEQKPEDKSKDEDSQDIDFKKELEDLEKTKEEKPRDELAKAMRSLHFNAQRVAELGGDPTEVLPKPKVEVKTETEPTDVRRVVQETLAEQEARRLSNGNDDLYKVIMWRVKNQNLSVEEAHLLANKGKYLKRETEQRRADVQHSPGGGAGQRVQEGAKAPELAPAEVALLERRGLKFDAKTQTYKGKHTEQYWDGTQWATRRRTS